jgi:hypothetical protein
VRMGASTLASMTMMNSTTRAPATKPATVVKAPATPVKAPGTAAVKHVHEDAYEGGPESARERHERRVEHAHSGGSQIHHHDSPRFGVGKEVKLQANI